jgi:hypothetical protein
MSGCITIQDLVYTNEKVFKINEQYKFDDIVEFASTCCGPKPGLYYKVVCDEKTYYIPKDSGVETTVMIPLNDQSFYNVWSKEFLQNQDHHNYEEINQNCINCNGLFVHGDYNNNTPTGGFKDPDIVFKPDEQ